MSGKRNIILYLAMSLDGYIATEDHGVEWLHEAAQAGVGDNGYSDFYNTIDTLVMGRATYDFIQNEAETFPYPGKKCYVFTTKTDLQPDPNVEFVNEDIASFAEKLEGNVWLVGGGSLLSAFLKAKQIDELILTYVPILLGKGISLFTGDAPQQKLVHTDTTQYGQLVQLTYQVQR